MADYGAFIPTTGDYTEVPTSALQPRDNPLPLFETLYGDWVMVPTSALQPRDNPMPVWLGAELPVKSEITYYYAMRGKDNAGYKTWVATGSPDVNASQYVGSISGTMTDIVVLQTWTK